MTPEQLKAAKIGDNVTLERNGHKITRGRITQATNRWFMVMWADGVPEVIRRETTILTSRLHLEAKT